MGLSRQEHWAGLPFPSPEDLPDPGSELGSLAWQADSLPSESPAKLTGQRTFDEGARNTQWGKVVSSAKFWDTGETCRTNQIRCLCCAVLSRVRLSATLWTVAHQALLSMRILQARTLQWVATPSSRGSSQPRDRTQVSCIAGRFFTI
ncbi:unnamed protein product [Rangifer tarandus platyrhynchus]|uniref:Uncharacterized protein n=1 Tax=Rangifer tarandus platyrhynchus TaxID=3082113 RepID=A0ABN8XUS3_RANTA|nr:unnamed protein product [Rangifer tarandus platyrhynchus]